ncbi:MAG: hypothetical protein ACI909_002207, partial [Planctomycetota bacterium]
KAHKNAISIIFKFFIIIYSPFLKQHQIEFDCNTAASCQEAIVCQ